MAKALSVRRVSISFVFPYDYAKVCSRNPEKTKKIEDLKFNDDDVTVVGTLEYGQYGVVS